MSKQIARLLKTDMMGDLDLKSLAQLLRSRGRGNDKILAHITAREAKRLKDEGGSGTINPDTGLPEYADDYDYIGEPADIAQANPDLYPGGQLPAQDESTAYFNSGTSSTYGPPVIFANCE
jgi:methylmalonyl-CoA mutase cobalamin-binding subunit